MAEFSYIIDTKLVWSKGKAKRVVAPDHVQLHHTVSSYGTPSKWNSLHEHNISKGNKGVPYSYLVCQDGTILLGRGHENTHGGVKDSLTGKIINGRTFGANQRSIAVALDGDMRKSDLPTSAQLASAVKLIKDIIKLYNLSPSDVLGHNEVPLYSNGKPTGKLYQTLCPSIKEEYGLYPQNMHEFRAMVAGTVDVPTYVYTRRTLSKGMKGADVTEAQTLLIQLGYGDIVGKIDGDFGTKTESAVNKLRDDNKLEKTGIIDQLVWSILDKNYKLEDIEDDDGDEESEQEVPEPTESPVAPPDNEEEISESMFPKFYKYSGSTYINLRNAIKTGTVLMKVSKDERVVVLQEKDDWFELVAIDASPIRRGWASKTYFKEM